MRRSRLSSFKDAFAGIKHFFQSEVNAKIHTVAAALAIVCGWHFEISRTEWCLVALSIALVLSAEAFNTAVEHLTDLVSPDFHPLAKRAKDVAAGAVLLTALGALAVGLLIFLPKLAEWVGGF